MKEETFKQFTNILEEARAQNRLLTEANYEMQKQLKEIRK